MKKCVKEINFLFIFLLLIINLNGISAFGFENELTFDYQTSGLEINDLEDVYISSPLDTQLLLYNESSSIWYNSYLNSSAHFVNASDYWITNLGALNDVNDTQFNNPNTELNIDESWISSLWCRLTGCDMTGPLTFDNSFIQNPNYIQFNTTFANGQAEGRLQWNQDDGTLEVGMPGGDVNLQIGQENLIRATNKEGSTIINGQIVYVSGASGSNPEIRISSNDNATKSRTIGVATEDILNNQKGYVTTFGLVRDINTSNIIDGGIAWLGINGSFTGTRPTSPTAQIAIGIVLRSHATEGVLYTNPLILQQLSQLSDVYSVGLIDNSILRYNLTSNRFEVSTSYTRDEVDELLGGINLELFFKNTSSGISTYLNMNKTANGRPKNSSSIILSADSTFLGGYISNNASDIGIIGLADGIISAHFHANVDSVVGKKTVNGYFEIYKRYSNSTELFLTRSHLVEVVSISESEYEAHANLLDELDLNESDRLVIKLYANLSGSGGNPTLTTYIQGDTLARAEFSTLGINFATKGDLEDYVPYTGATNNLDMGEKNITAQVVSWGGGYITSNATCSYLRYNTTGTLKESECP